MCQTTFVSLCSLDTFIFREGVNGKASVAKRLKITAKSSTLHFASIEASMKSEYFSKMLRDDIVHIEPWASVARNLSSIQDTMKGERLVTPFENMSTVPPKANFNCI